MSTAYLPYGIHMVHSWTMHGHQGRSNYSQHGLCVNYINRVAIQWGLLVEFSCDSYIDSLLRALLIHITIGLYVQQLPQQQNSTTFWDSVSCRLLSLLYSLSFSIKDSVSKVKKIYSWALGLRGILARQEKLSQSFAWQPTCVYQSYHLL